MASSGDELGTYEQSPRVFGRASSKTSADVAGPSKATSKRKKPETVETHKDDPGDAIAISSGDDDAWTTRRGRAATGATTHLASNGHPTSSKGKGKVTAASKRIKMVDASEAGIVEETAKPDADAIISLREKVRQADENAVGKSYDLLRKQNEHLKKQLEDITEQREAMSKQLEELFQLRHTAAEAQLIEQRMQYEAILKAQEDNVHELKSALSHADKISGSGATTTLHFLTREAADEEKNDVQREVAELKDSLTRRDEIIRAKDVELANLNETIRILRTDLKLEIENSKSLASRTAPSSATKSNDSKHGLVIGLYEKLTNLLVINVAQEPGKFRGDDAIFNCVQTAANGKSLNFLLRSYKDTEERDTPSKASRTERIVDKVIYTPVELEKESQEFVDQLDFLARPFTFQEEQMSVFSKTLLTYLEGEGEDSQSNADQMEYQDD